MIIFNEMEFTKGEKELIGASEATPVHTINKTSTISKIYLAKTIKGSIDQLVISNNNLEKSNDKHNRRIFSLTIALVFVGIVQAITTIVQVIAQ